MGSKLKYIVIKLRIGITISAVGFTVFAVLDIWKNGVCYLLGFLSGCLNFILLTLSVWFVTNTKHKKPVLLYRLFFIVRYLLILDILLSTINPNANQVVMFCIGLLSVNFSVILSSYKFKFNPSKEG